MDYFGYLPWEQEYFLNYGENVLDITLDPAPSGVLTGTIRETETELPLEATVKVYRLDTMELFAETTSDEVTGVYTTPSLPYFDYRVVAKAWHHIPVTVDLTINQPTTTQDFWLEPTIGDLLVIDDGAKSPMQPAKKDEKTGEVIGDAYRSDAAKALADVLADLETIGYTTTVETMSATDPATWANYDLLMTCSGDNTDPLGDAGFRSDLIDYVLSGGRLLIEGGEVGYDHYGDTNFATTVLHITDWDADNSGNVTVVEPDHYVVSVPNVITGPIAVSYGNFGDQDALDATADAVRVGSWTNQTQNASIIAYDPNPAPEGGQIVFFAFNYSAMDSEVRPLLLQNTVNWLITAEVGDCTVEGTVTLEGETDHSGVEVEAIPGGGFVYTDASGHYMLEGLFAGAYSIVASKEGWTTGTQEISLSQGEHLTGVDFELYPVQTYEECRDPNLAIPDNNPTGVSDDMEIFLGTTVTEIAAYVNITHTYQGDLIVDLTSPPQPDGRQHA